jgi:hypothetical protein
LKGSVGDSNAKTFLAHGYGSGQPGRAAAYNEYIGIKP